MDERKRFEETAAERFSRWNEEILPLIRNALEKWGLPWDVAQNVTQELLLKGLIHSNAGRKWNDAAAEWAWVFRAAHRMAMDYHRGRGRETRALHAWAEVVGPPSDIDPANHTMNEEFNAKLRQVLEKLPTKYQAVLNECIVGKMTAGELATMLDVPPSTVRGWKARMLRILREKLPHA